MLEIGLLLMQKQIDSKVKNFAKKPYFDSNKSLATAFAGCCFSYKNL